MKRFYLTIKLFILAGSISASAQSTTKYLLNNTEIAPESVFFFNQNDIDSIRQFVAKDTTIVFYTHHPEKILSYYQLLDRHLIDKAARKLPVDLTSAINIQNPEKMVFSEDRVTKISISYLQPAKTQKVFIAETYEYWDQKSEKGKLLSKIRRKFNNIKP